MKFKASYGPRREDEEGQEGVGCNPLTADSHGPGDRPSGVHQFAIDLALRKAKRPPSEPLIGEEG